VKISRKTLAEILKNDRFPLSAKYDAAWNMENEMGPNALWLTEFLVKLLSPRAYGVPYGTRWWR